MKKIKKRQHLNVRATYRNCKKRNEIFQTSNLINFIDENNIQTNVILFKTQGIIYFTASSAKTFFLSRSSLIFQWYIFWFCGFRTLGIGIVKKNTMCFIFYSHISSSGSLKASARITRKGLDLNTKHMQHVLLKIKKNPRRKKQQLAHTRIYMYERAPIHRKT